ncbi:hypothetical protein AOQ84DRAFT_359101 [Glonium stellatum]|uniref:Rhodopsin domain-containing protein n=1 Tax=Glonium stellatum TaxID=574774 RepID=A0A8E2FBM8_9PEZI|nr:hypothetical protein AOQ84DRAFT_359101 [Glonium stellatum]
MAVIARQNSPPSLPPDYPSYTITPQLLTIESTLTGLAVFTFILRVYVRASMLRVFGIDDYLMLAAVIMAIAVLICFVSATHLGFGKHILAILPQDMGKLFH